MAFQNYLNRKKTNIHHGNTSVVDLIRNSRKEEKLEKRKNIIMAATAVGALLISGLIISS